MGEEPRTKNLVPVVNAVFEVVFAVAVQEVTDVVKKRGGDHRGRLCVPLGQGGALEGVFELRHGLAVVLTAPALDEQLLDALQHLGWRHVFAPHQSSASPNDRVMPAPPGATAITHPGCGSVVTNNWVGCLA